MWAKCNLQTGALIADMLTDEPEPGNYRVVEMPPSAVAGLTVWSATAHGYVDPPPPVPLIDFLRLWTLEERTAVRASENVIMVDAYNLTLASPVINLSNAEVMAGIALAQSLGILTEARAARILAGLPPA